MAGTNTIVCSDRSMLIGFKHGILSCTDNVQVVRDVAEEPTKVGLYYLILKDQSDMENMSMHLGHDGLTRLTTF